MDCPCLEIRASKGSAGHGGREGKTVPQDVTVVWNELIQSLQALFRPPLLYKSDYTVIVLSEGAA
jgi:hypothetical protein